MMGARVAAIVVLVFSAGLSGCRVANANWPYGLAQSPGAGCKVLGEIDTAKLAALAAGAPTDIHPRDPAYEQAAQDILSRLQPNSSAPADADAEIRIAGMSGLSYGAHSIVAARVRGVWSVSQVSTDRGQGDGRGPLTKNTAQLDPAATAHLNALLADGCLWKTPVVLADSIPLKNGADSGVCLDGGTFYFDIRSGGRRWRGAQYCGVYGAPGEIVAALRRSTDPQAGAGFGDRRLVALNRTQGPNSRLLPLPLGLLQYGVVAIWAAAFIMALRRFRWRGLWVLAALPLVYVGWFVVLDIVRHAYWAWVSDR